MGIAAVAFSGPGRATRGRCPQPAGVSASPPPPALPPETSGPQRKRNASRPGPLEGVTPRPMRRLGTTPWPQALCRLVTITVTGAVTVNLKPVTVTGDGDAVYHCPVSAQS